MADSAAPDRGEHPHFATSLQAVPSAAFARPMKLSPDGKPASADPDNRRRSEVALPARCYAGLSAREAEGFGEPVPVEHIARKVSNRQTPARCYLLAEPDVVTQSEAGKGMRLVVVNGLEETASFDAQDRRLYIVQEAKDANGQWRPIEYLTSSWCGNSYYSVSLEAGEYWEFAVPRYEGTVRV